METASTSIQVSLQMLLMKGIPECFLVSWAIHFFTNTKMEWKKYLLISIVYTAATYLIRFLPITLGVNTILSLFVLIFTFQLVHKADLAKVTRAVISSVIVLILTAVSELINALILTSVYGREKADELLRFADDMTRALFSAPSTLLLAGFIVAAYFITKKIYQKKALKDGSVREENRK